VLTAAYFLSFHLSPDSPPASEGHLDLVLTVSAVAVSDHLAGLEEQVHPLDLPELALVAAKMAISN
jgi:hypothetical protein